MKKDYYSKEADKDDILDSLIRAPKKNLDSRIKQLTKDIRTRQALSDKALSSLATHQTKLNERLWQLRYMSVLNDAFISQRNDLLFQRYFNNSGKDHGGSRRAGNRKTKVEIDG
jgi:hypothetical protein